MVIQEFRANGGLVGGPFEGADLLLMTTAGARTGKPHTNPAVYLRDGDRLLVFGSNAGGPKHPDWYHNLLADPQVTIEIRENGAIRKHAAQAVPLEGAERDHFYEVQSRLAPAFRAYAEATTRVIPVVALNVLRLDADRVKAIGVQLRRHHDALRAELRRLREDPTTRRDLRDHCLAFCDNMRMHHLREEGAFTAFEDHDPALAPVFARLREEHHVVAGVITEIAGLADDPDRLRPELDRLAEELETHFAYEEAHIG
ncbi:nitroreductase/quinone reductase family protein [Saccharothrix deserti]|uniref:nitroreductase/quinone reductase family protein n=1 Tax=Saccharothrix deserti TaxID=2593674 RepID=UPI001EE42045|nr:nitroreductase/quinone reductase family protein [Saccharothrix deserti]